MLLLFVFGVDLLRPFEWLLLLLFVSLLRVLSCTRRSLGNVSDVSEKVVKRGLRVVVPSSSSSSPPTTLRPFVWLLFLLLFSFHVASSSSFL